MAPEAPAAAAGPPLLSLRGITKAFPETLANDRIDLDLHAGEIHALLGENGAGKSTLVKSIYGLLKPDAGTIRWQDRPVHIASPAAARRLGIGMVFQHFSLFEPLTVAENIALGLHAAGSIAGLAGAIEQVSRRYGLALEPRRPVYSLSVGERQRVEIVRCLLQDARLLIMDEPTSVLTPQETETLFATLRQLRAEGRSILFISHKLEEIRSLCDRATILRAGRVVAVTDPRAGTARSLAELMVGRRLAGPEHGAAVTAGPERLAVRRLSLKADTPLGTDLVDLDLAVRGGEVLGIAGVAGNGQAELLAALNGERAVPPEAILIDGKPAGRLGPAARRRLGLAFVPEERLGRGAVAELSLAENTLLTADPEGRLVRGGFIDFAGTAARAGRIIREFGVVAAGPRAPARSLSGGNLQKFIIGRALTRGPAVLVVGAPTWGVDAAATVAVQQALIGQARAGSAVVVVSQDLDELLAIADRIVVMFRGRLTRPFRPAAVSVDEIGLMMGGSAVDPAPRALAEAHP